MKEDWAIILDYLPMGYPGGRRLPIAQAIGERFFTLLELIPKKDVKLSLRERVYIGPEKREKIQSIKGRLRYDRLTGTAKNELEDVVRELVKKRESDFVAFFNKAGPITIRQHSLELLPHIGKKHMKEILMEREKRPFESFEDLKSRVSLMPDPVKVISEAIIAEIKGEAKYKILESFLRRIELEKKKEKKS